VNEEEIALDLALVYDFLEHAKNFDVSATKFNRLLNDLLEKKEESQ
jgi:hypothetical protein